MKQPIKIKNAGTAFINDSLLYVIKLIGVPPEKLIVEDNMIIIDYLQRNLKNFNAYEIRNAFEAGIRGELDVDMKHFHSFNSMYVVNVIQSYKRYLASIKRNRPEKTKPFIALTFDESRQHAKEVEEKYFKNTLEKGFSNWTIVYEYLRKEGKISLSKEQIADFQLKCRLDINDELRELSKSGRTSFSLVMALEMDDLFYCECRKRAVLEHYKTLK